MDKLSKGFQFQLVIAIFSKLYSSSIFSSWKYKVVFRKEKEKWKKNLDSSLNLSPTNNFDGRT